MFRRNMETAVDSTNYKIKWVSSIFLIMTPIAAIVGVAWHSTSFGVYWTDPAILLAFYLMTGMSVTGGYHRCFSHRSHEARWPLRLFYAVFGASAFQDSIVRWSSDHRSHHKYVDNHPSDPYSSKKGFFWSHMGWIFVHVGEQRPVEGVDDLKADPIVRWQEKWLWPIAIFVGFFLPAIVGGVIGLIYPSTGGWLARAIGGFVWGGLIKVVVIHHTTFLINSAAHWTGRQPYDSSNTSKDNDILAFLTLGEGYHNFHHAFVADYRNGIRWWQFDPTKWWIRFWNIFGLTHGLKRTSDRAINTAKSDEKWRKTLAKSSNLSANAHDKFEKRYKELRSKMRSAFDHLTEVKKNRASDLQEAKKRISEVLGQLKSLFAEVRSFSNTTPA